MVDLTAIKDCKTVLEEGINELLDSQKAITKIKVKCEKKMKLTDEEIELNINILDTHLEELKKLREGLLKLYKPYKDK